KTGAVESRERANANSRVEGAIGVAKECPCANGRVARAGGVGKERRSAHGRVAGAGVRFHGVGVVKNERPRANSRVAFAGSVQKKRPGTDCRVKVGGRGVAERPPANRCIESAEGEHKKGFFPFCGVRTEIAAVRWRIDRLRDRHQPKTEKYKCDKN